MTPWPVDQPIPAVVTLPQVLSILQISRRTFERKWVKGEIPLTELHSISRERRFSGESMQRYLRGRFISPTGRVGTSSRRSA